ncbi:MAG: hypothetical protein ACKVS6_08690 [Planctomycetota bacterium]
MNNSVAKGCLAGIGGCAVGCLAFAIGLMLMFSLFFSACFMALPNTISQFQHDAVALEIHTDAPANSIDRITDQMRGAFSSVSTWRVNDRAWIRLGGPLSNVDISEARDAIQNAIRDLEFRGVLPKGSVTIVLKKH